MRTARLTACITALVALTSPLVAHSNETAAPLTNLDHLDFLTDTVRVSQTAEHTTYRLAEQPEVGVLWVYADRRPDGSYQRIGGGGLDPATGHWGQGSYDADDISRAAVVYLRQWQADGDEHAREQAMQQLRGLTYLQVATGPNRGNVVLWMQPDGTLNKTPTPPDSPNPSDSGASYWLARTIWALGEGYAAFRHGDPAFAAFLRQRLELSIDALRRQVLVNYGEYRMLHGVKVPAWLVVDGGDASSEAVLGLAAYVRAGGSPAARTALRQLADGIAGLGMGRPGVWPYGALLPWAQSLSVWHAWGAQLPSALAEASAALRDRDLLEPAVRDSAGFTPGLLASYGPVNGLLPSPDDRTQIAYGADGRVQGLAAVARETGRQDLRRLAGLAAGWYFGQNNAGVTTYDPASGITFDGVNGDGVVNRNSGAESTIHGLLTMQLLDANPDLAALARAAGEVRSRQGETVSQAETAQLSGPAQAVTPPSAWTGESQYSGGAYAAAGTGSIVTWSLPEATTGRVLRLVVALEHRSKATVTVSAGGRTLGIVDARATGPQGAAASDRLLVPVTLRGLLPGGTGPVTATVSGGEAWIDALQVAPATSRLETGAGTLLVDNTSHGGFRIVPR